MKYDIESFLSQGNSSSFSPTYVPQADKEVPISGMRQVIADRLVESKQQVPHFYLDVECIVDKLLV